MFQNKLLKIRSFFNMSKSFHRFSRDNSIVDILKFRSESFFDNSLKFRHQFFESRQKSNRSLRNIRFKNFCSSIVYNAKKLLNPDYHKKLHAYNVFSSKLNNKRTRNKIVKY